MRKQCQFLFVLLVCLVTILMIFPIQTIAASIPSVPYNLKATSYSSSAIDLEWDYVSQASTYYVYRSTSSSGTYTQIATVYSESYRDTGLGSHTTYYYKVRAHNSYGTSDYSYSDYATTDYYDSSGIDTNRLGGQNRYETTAKVSREGWSNSDYAVVASGEDYPDALCGTPLAGLYNAPILLTSKYDLESETRDELSRLKVRYVFLVGGYGVVSTSVEQKIEEMGIKVTRLEGKDRYETSLRVAEKMGYVNQAIIATGDNFPDALSIAPIAAMKRIPILLTEKNQLPQDIKNYLRDRIQSTVVVGGTGVISNTIYNQLPSPKRLSGDNRYDTNLNIVKAYIDDFNFDTSYIATGENFPDALAGSALASLRRAPILLVNNTVTSAQKTFLNNQDVNHVVAFGGTGVVPESILTSLGSTTSVAPSAPTALSATAVDTNEIYLDWDSVARATSYYIYRASSYNGTYSRIATVTATYYYDSGLSDNQTYYYKIQAHNGSGTSDYSSRVSATTDYETYLNAPTDLEATALSSSQIYLTWDSVYNATSYYVYRATSSSGSYSKIATVSDEYYTDTGLTANRTYYYKVQAHRSNATSSYSAGHYATTSQQNSIPATPTNLKANPMSPTQITLTWNPVQGASSYFIYRSDALSGTYTQIATVTTDYFTNSDLTPGSTYFYKVRAYNGSLSAYTSAVSTTTPLPNLAEGFVAENFNTNESTDYVGVNVGWNIGANTDIVNITAMKVELYDSSNRVMATNTGVIEQLGKVQGKQFSTAFIIREGTYKKSEDPYWTFGTWTPKSDIQPVKAKITLTDFNGRAYTVENSSLTSEVGKTWGELFDSPQPPTPSEV